MPEPSQRVVPVRGPDDETVKASAMKKIQHGPAVAIEDSSRQETTLNRPLNIDYILFQVDRMMSGGDLQDAGRIVANELIRYPACFPLLLRLGEIDEKNNQYFNAFEIYRHIGNLAQSDAEKDELQEALERVENKMRSTIDHGDDYFAITIEGNSEPLVINYNLSAQERRRELLEAIISTIDPAAESVLELESKSGLIARNLALHGYGVEAAAATAAEALEAIGFETAEVLRACAGPRPACYQLALDGAVIDLIEPRDVILLLPSCRSWYGRFTSSALETMLGMLAERASSQLYFYFPPPARNEAGETLSASGPINDRPYLSDIASSFPSGSELCFTDSAGGCLYLLEKPGATGADSNRLLPPGPPPAHTRSQVFTVETAYCRSENGFAYTAAGWNHHRALLAQLLAEENPHYEQSLLKDFYDCFQPRNRREQLFGRGKEALMPLERGWVPLPWALPAVLDSAHDKKGSSPLNELPCGSRFGPHSTLYGKHETAKTLQAYEQISRHGYRPGIYPNGYIRGTFLKNKDRYRFIISDGERRLAAAAFCGLETIKARFNPRALPVADLERIKSWPLVQSGFYDEKVAAKVFHHYFCADGRTAARQLGFLA